MDPKNRRFSWSIDTGNPVLGDWHGEIIGFFGHKAVVQVMFYARKNDWPTYSKDRLRIQESFQFDTGKTYRSERKRSRVSVVAGHILFWLGVVLIVSWFPFRRHLIQEGTWQSEGRIRAYLWLLGYIGIVVLGSWLRR